MTLAEILSDDTLRRREFPVTASKIFLAHAGVSPLPQRVAEAVTEYLSAARQEDQETFVLAPLVRRARELAARLVGARPDEIALVGPTSVGLSYIARGLTFSRGDNIIIYFDDYPSNVYPWLALKEQGVEIRLLKARGLGAITIADLEPLIDRQTRLVALASCHFISGIRIDVAAIGAFLRERGVLFCLDAIQTLGSFPTPAASVDFLAADAHKWLLGPCGAGILFVRKELQDTVRPAVYGWNNIRCPRYVAQETLVLQPGGQRYEAGTHNLLGLTGLCAAMELLLEVGVEAISTELLRKRAWFVPRLQHLGYTVDEPGEGVGGSGIISAYQPGIDLRPLHQKLEKKEIVASLRFARNGQNYLRFSPHFYNTDGELEEVLRCL